MHKTAENAQYYCEIEPNPDLSPDPSMIVILTPDSDLNLSPLPIPQFHILLPPVKCAMTFFGRVCGNGAR